MRVRYVSIAVGFCLIAGCKDKNRIDLNEEYRTPAPPSTVTIANMVGTCEDIATCERECDAGSSDRCRRLGATYQFAEGATKDETKAATYYEKSCAMGNASGCVSSGQMFEFAHGVSKDDTKAAGFYKKGCDLGYMVGCANYAIMLENGRGVPKDIPQAIPIYENACKAGAGLACDRLRALTHDAAAGPSPVMSAGIFDASKP